MLKITHAMDMHRVLHKSGLQSVSDFVKPTEPTQLRQDTEPTEYRTYRTDRSYSNSRKYHHIPDYRNSRKYRHTEIPVEPTEPTDWSPGME